MKKKTTLADIAKKLGVTISTVSRALNDHPKISTATKKAVIDLVDKMNYQPNNIATALQSGKSNIIGVIVPTSDRQFFASVIRGIEEVVRKEGYNLIICQSDEQTVKEQKIIDALLQIQVDGIIASVAKETTCYSYFDKIIHQNVPLILFDRVGQNIDTSTVVSNDYKGAYDAVSHLIEQGCQHIAHIKGLKHIKIYQDRLNGYLDALKHHQIPVDEDLIIESDLIDDPDIILEAGIKMTNHLFMTNHQPDGIFSSSDFAAFGSIEALKSKCINIPEEVSIIGYSNDFSSSIIDPGLSSVDQHTKKMGNSAGTLFLDQVNSSIGEYRYKQVVIDPTLIIRKSSSPNLIENRKAISR
ncbi:LacI family DNA-binding transcriptional regulator [Rhodohalobacter sp.]|uniref:LacI family DNA-binding transcriptional regulator n=1 Tax=Rhodohalobacter sp. TaxID=1974210 RepID=UPI003569D2BC